MKKGLWGGSQGSVIRKFGWALEPGLAGLEHGGREVSVGGCLCMDGGGDSATLGQKKRTVVPNTAAAHQPRHLRLLCGRNSNTPSTQLNSILPAPRPHKRGATARLSKGWGRGAGVSPVSLPEEFQVAAVSQAGRRCKRQMCLALVYPSAQEFQNLGIQRYK